MIMEGNSFPVMKTLTVYSGPECEARQVHRLEDVVDGLSSGISVTWTKASEVPDDEQYEPESGGASASLGHNSG